MDNQQSVPPKVAKYWWRDSVKLCHCCLPQFPLMSSNGKRWGSRVTNTRGGHDISVCLGRPVMLRRLVFQLSVSTSCNPKEMQCLVFVCKICCGDPRKAGGCITTILRSLCFLAVWHVVWWKWSHLAVQLISFKAAENVSGKLSLLLS